MKRNISALIIFGVKFAVTIWLIGYLLGKVDIGSELTDQPPVIGPPVS